MSDDSTAIHQSGLKDFRQCEAKWAYRYVERLGSEYDSVPLTLGTWMHAALAAYYLSQGLDDDSLLFIPDRLDLPDKDAKVSDDGRTLTRGRLEGNTNPETVIAFARQWWHREADDAFREDYLDRYGGIELHDHLDNMVLRYLDRWDDEDDDRLVLGVEVQWRRRVPGTEVDIAGTVDLILHDTRLNLTIIDDLKTTGQWRSQPDFVVDLMNSQLHLYAWGVAEMLDQYGYTPAALEWNRIRTKVPTPPKLTKSGRLSKTVTDFDLWTYERWATIPKGPVALPDDHHLRYPGRKKDGSDGGVYEIEQDVVDRLVEEYDKFFRRRLFPVNETVLRRHVVMAVRDARTQRDMTLDTAARSTGEWCSWCDYLTLCRSHLFGDTPTDDYRPEDFGLVPTKEKS